MYIVSAITIIILSLNYIGCQESFNHPIELNSDMVKKIIKQPLDHFDPNEKRTFNFKYYGRRDNLHSPPNAPIYIWLMGSMEDAPDFFEKRSCLLDQLVKEMNGTMYITIERYEVFNSLDNILLRNKDFFKFLTTEQILADFASMIKSIKAQPGFESSKVVLVGTNEGARQATYMRMLYPDLVDAVVASNAALLAKKDFKEYFDVIHHAYEKYGTTDCLNKIEKYYHSLEEMFKTTEGIQTLIGRFSICDTVNNFTAYIDKQWFWYRGMYLKDCMLLSWKTSSYVKTACEEIPTETVKINPPVLCWDCHVDNWKESFNLFGYLYKQCSEFGQFITTSMEKQPFVHWIPLDYHLQLCQKFFGIDEKKVNEGIEKTKDKFGGITPNVTNVVFTYGELDPQRLLGVQRNLSDTVVSFLVDGVGTLNVPYVTSTDSKELIETRKAVISLIKKWIAP